MKKTLAFLLFNVLLSLEVLSAAADPVIWAYSVPPREHSDETIRGTVNGTPVPFSCFRNYPGCYYDTSFCRFASRGPVDVEITAYREFTQVSLRGLWT